MTEQLQTQVFRKIHERTGLLRNHYSEEAGNTLRHHLKRIHWKRIKSKPGALDHSYLPTEERLTNSGLIISKIEPDANGMGIVFFDKARRTTYSVYIQVINNQFLVTTLIDFMGIRKTKAEGIHSAVGMSLDELLTFLAPLADALEEGTRALEKGIGALVALDSKEQNA